MDRPPNSVDRANRSESEETLLVSKSIRCSLEIVRWIGLKLNPGWRLNSIGFILLELIEFDGFNGLDPLQMSSAFKV